jgi:integrase/recombinase XerD
LGENWFWKRLGYGNWQRAERKKYPLVPSVIQWLKQLRLASGAKSGSVLLSPRSKTPISITSLHDEFKRYVKICGLNEKEISLHRMRHTYGTFLHEHGFDLREIQEALGHEELSSVLGYVEVSKKNLREKIKRAFSNEKQERPF